MWMAYIFVWQNTWKKWKKLLKEPGHVENTHVLPWTFFHIGMEETWKKLQAVTCLKCIAGLSSSFVRFLPCRHGRNSIQKSEENQGGADEKGVSSIFSMYCAV